MSTSCIITAIMQRNAAVFIVVFLLFCLSFNYTFPLHRDIKFYRNHSQVCERPNHHGSGPDETNSPRKMLHFNRNNNLTEEDIRQYEQMVIMKKYPYLEVKEFDLKFNPSMKIVRQSKYESNPNFESEPGFFEPPEDRPNVEIISRGLSGFSIPSFTKRLSSLGETKTLTEGLNSNDKKPVILMKKSSDKQKLNSLRTDVVQFYEYVKLNNK